MRLNDTAAPRNERANSSTGAPPRPKMAGNPRQSSGSASNSSTGGNTSGAMAAAFAKLKERV
jgi:ribosomal protein L4